MFAGVVLKVSGKLVMRGAVKFFSMTRLYEGDT